MKLSIIQFSPELGNIDHNISTLETLFSSMKEKPELVVLPELASTGYKFKDRNEALLYSEEVNNSRFIEFLTTRAKQMNCYMVAGFNEREGNKLYNSSVLTGPGGVVGIYRKLHLFWDEKDLFEPGNLGLPTFDTELGRIGMLICFDWMFPETWRALALKGAQLIAHPANLVLPYCQSVVPAYSLVNRLYIATANRIGTEDELTFTGQSVISGPKGEIIATGKTDTQEIISVDIDLAKALDKQITPRNNAFSDRRVDVYGNYGV
ncbi:carbon-nitrogen hydrolase [Marinilabiliaceae bacterium JC017]|nr:carbon-nitrogen hydrolase [Marinilabiliaceae bacterium JC017]